MDIRMGKDVLDVEDVHWAVKRRAEIVAELKTIYGTFKAAEWRTMVEHESRLVELANELSKLTDIISRYEFSRKQRANILEIWQQLEATSLDPNDSSDQS